MSYTDNDLQELLKVPPSELGRAIARHPTIRITETAEVMNALEALRQPAPSAATAVRSPQGDDLALVGGAAGLTAMVGVGRLKELLGGNEMKYSAPFKIMDLRNKLQVALGKTMDVNFYQPNKLAIVEVEGEKPVCEILITVEDDETTVIVSGLDTTDAKAGFTGALEGFGTAFKQKRKGADILDIAQTVLGGIASAAGETLETLGAGNTIASTIESYGADLERKALQIRRQQAQAKSDEDAREAAKTICKACGAAHGGGEFCKNCGTPTGLG